MSRLESYFIRHSRRWGICDAAIEALWDGDLIAIHFPHDKYGRLGRVDNQSKNPDDYPSGYAKGVVRRLKQLGREGGYVWAQYQGHHQVKVGMVRPGTPIRLKGAKWKGGVYPERRKGARAVLKTLQLTSVRVVDPDQADQLPYTIPPNITMCLWPTGGAILERLVRSLPLKPSYHSLSPSRQEALCSEFLRRHRVRGLPRLEYLLAPVGRTRKDVDIFGVTKRGRKLYCQVTHATLDRAHRKLEALRKYNSRRNVLVLFCDANRVRVEDGVTIIPVSQVWTWCKTRRVLSRQLRKL